MKRRNRRGFSFGTLFMSALLILVLGGSAYVLARLSSGTEGDLTRAVHTALQLGAETTRQGIEDILIREPGGENTRTGSGNAAGTGTPSGGGAGDAAREKAVLAQEAGDGVRSFTLTVGGTAAIETEIRRSCYSNDSGKYDFTDVMMLLRDSMRSDWNCVFLENILSDEYKVNATIVPTTAAEMLRGAGIGHAACGFGKAYDKGTAGVRATLAALQSSGLEAVGLYEPDGAAGFRVVELGGVRAAFLQYTDTLTAAVRKSLAKDGVAGALPEADPERIGADIAEARNRGAEFVAVLIQWGKAGKAVDKAQRELAQQIADAGADLIIGCGSRLPQAAEMLQTERNGQPGQTLCAYSLGTLLSDNRDNAKRLSGYLLHATVRCETGKAPVVEASYTPTYLWRFKQDGKYFYRCVPADGPAPDGMDSEQTKMRERAEKAVADALAGSPLEKRE